MQYDININDIVNNLEDYEQQDSGTAFKPVIYKHTKNDRFANIAPPRIYNPFRLFDIDDGGTVYEVYSTEQYVPTEKDTQEQQTQKQEVKQEAKQETASSEAKPDETASPSKINDIINTARKFVGGKYVSGGYRPESGGFDCSGLLYYAFNQNGVKLSRATYDIFKQGQEIKDIKDVQPGDIICTPGSGKTRKHVKMVSKIVDGTIYVIEAKGRKYGILEHPLTKTNNITTIRRIVPTMQEGGKLEQITPIVYKHPENKQHYRSGILLDAKVEDPFNPYNFDNYEDEIIHEIIQEIEPVTEQQDSQKEEEQKQVEETKSESESESADKQEGDLSEESKKGIFPNTEKGRKEFHKKLFATYQKVLKKRGLDPEWAYILTASASIESSYGNGLGAHFNYGGVKVTTSQIEKGVAHMWSETPDWATDKNGKLYLKNHAQPFRAYTSMEDFCDKVITLLSNDRYDMFNRYKPHEYINTWYHILDSGYAKSNYENQMSYAKSLNDRVKRVKKDLNK